jgi:ABC-type ATPase with predicted acetyltransferase domain
MSTAKDKSQLLRMLETTAPCTPRLMRTCSMFGVGLSQSERARSPQRVCKRQLHNAMRALDVEGQIVHLSGASGRGKSTLLRAIVRRLREQGRVVLVSRKHAMDQDCSLMDCMPGSLQSALDALAEAGLADATLYPRRFEELSEGQQARASIAHVLAQESCELAPKPIVIVIDELASTLDELTARGACTALGKAIRRRKCVLLSASAREDVGAWLGAKHVVAESMMQSHVTQSASGVQMLVSIAPARATQRGELHWKE